MLKVTNDQALLPLLTGPTPINLDAFVSPAQNLVNGYNIAEQTCFHKTTVGNLVPSLKALSAAYTGLSQLVQASSQAVSDGLKLIGQLITLGGRVVTLLTDVRALITAVTTLVGTVIGLITGPLGIIARIAAIITSLGAIVTGARIAGFAAIAAGLLCAGAFVPVAGPVLLALGAIATAALLAIVFFVIAGLVAAIATSLGLINGLLTTLSGALGTLTTPLPGPLGTVSASLATVSGTLSSPGATPDVNKSLGDIQTALTALQNELGPKLNLFNTTAGVLTGRANTLDAFLKPTMAGPKIPRAHLEDTYVQAVDIYDKAINDLQGWLAGSGVWAAMIADPNNKPEITPNNTLDRRLPCVGAAIG